jgi:hypothetical protein
MIPDGSLIMGIVTIDLVNVINYNAISLIDFSYKRFNFCYGAHWERTTLWTRIPGGDFEALEWGHFSPPLSNTVSTLCPWYDT